VVGWTDVVADAEDPLAEEGKSQGIKDAKLLHHPCLFCLMPKLSTIFLWGRYLQHYELDS